MSTPQPFPIQASLPAKSATAVTPTQAESADADSKGVFGGVLNDELDSALATDAVTADAGLEESAIVGLPLDGNSLPPAINNQLQADIAELDPVTGDELLLATEPVDVSGLNPALLESSVKVSVATLAGKEPAVVQPGVTHVSTESIRFISNTPVTPVKTDNHQAVSLLPLTNAGIDGETQAVTQFKESLPLQKIFSPLTRQAEAGIEAGQIGRVIEQFSELKQRPAVTPTISTVVAATPLSEAGTAASTTSTTTQLSVDVPIQDQRWQKAFSQRVVWSVGNVQSAQLRINPAELGRIDIQVNVENDKANVVFTAQQGVVKDAIEQALPRLREMLAEQGVELENADIFHDNANQQQAATHDGSSQQDELDARTASGSRDDGQPEEGVFISDIAFNDDVVDFYV